MIYLRPAGERGHANHGWLDTWHSFSFAHYYDPQYMGVSALQVINDDTVAPGAGFATHGHENMEIISYVLAGGLEHRDSMGFGTVIRPGEVQRMSAGTGITHSEYNASDKEPVKFLQIWISPNKRDIEPSYEQKAFHDALHGRLCLVASPDGQDGSLTIHQDAELYAARLKAGEAVEYRLAGGRTAYLHVARGVLSLNGQALSGGDGAAVQQEDGLRLEAQEDTEVLLFNLP